MRDIPRDPFDALREQGLLDQYLEEGDREPHISDGACSDCGACIGSGRWNDHVLHHRRIDVALWLTVQYIASIESRISRLDGEGGNLVPGVH